MNYEHIVLVNDPTAPQVEPLTLNQLWQGLVVRAEDPVAFMQGLDRCDIVARTATGVERALHFGQTVICDRVHYEHEHRVRYEIPGGADYPDGELVMQIEQPAPGCMIVRFIYRLGAPIAADDDQYQDIVQQAWHESDLDTIRKIRELAAAGRLG
mgnify:CR=1 FL=1